jgi:hypothetical protein
VLADAARREDAGSFTAPFAGAHGWHCLNNSPRPIDVTLSVTGFQTKLHVAGWNKAPARLSAIIGSFPLAW